MGSGIQHLVAGENGVELALHRRQVAGIAALGIPAEADQQLRSVVEQDLRSEVAEGVTRTDRAFQPSFAPRVDEES